MIAESLSEGLLDPEEHSRLTRALQIRNRVVNDVALPLHQIRAVPAARTGTGPTIGALEEALKETGYSRFPVADPGGAYVGYLHIKDVLPLLDEPHDDTLALDMSMVRPLPRVPAVTAAARRAVPAAPHNSHLALVTADDGAVTAVVALEDLVEDLVGTVRDGTHRV